MKKPYFQYIMILLLSYSCINNKQGGGMLTLKVELEDKGTSFNDIFEKVELIPLELNENSFIKQIEHLELINDTLYVFDREAKSLIMFDGASGKHLGSIMRVGEGPDEYTYVYDVVIDSPKNEINLLSPFGFIYTYDLSGHFIKRNNLPNPPESYIHFRNFNDSTYLIWGNSFQNPNMGNIILLSKKTNEVINSFWKGEGIEDRFVVSPFWTYNERIYFSTSITNNVYQITPEGYNLIYKWDFGGYDIDKFRKKEIASTIDLKNSSERIRQIVQKMMDSDKLYRFNSRYENDLYYYAQIVFKNDKNLAPHIFYNKETGMSNYFFKTTEGLSFITYSFTKDYIIGELLTDNKDEVLFSGILNEKDKIKLNLIKEDDNPMILKIYFKHKNH